MDLPDWLAVYRHQRKRHPAVRAFLRSFRADLNRKHSRALLNRHLRPDSFGLEVGCGEVSIAPLARTILSDAYQDHAGAASLAREFFPAEKVPYPDARFDYLVNEHVLEHLPDPLSALLEWRRVLKPKGILFLTLPHPERTVDRFRSMTPIQHLIRDHEQGSQSTEDAHWEDWKTNVIDRGLAPHYESFDKDSSLHSNLIHRHVFTPESAAEMLKWAGFEVIHSENPVRDRFDSFCLIARKP